MKLNKYILLGLAVITPVIATADRGLHTLNSDVNNANSQLKNDSKEQFPYIAIRGGWTKFNKIIKNEDSQHKFGYNARVALGLSSKTFDYELEGIYTSYNHKTIGFTKIGAIKDGWTTSYSAILNIYLNLIENKLINPYIGVGVGLTKPYFKKYVINDSDIKLRIATSYQLIGGLKLNISDNVKLLTDYRFFSTFKKLKSNNFNHNLYKFKNGSINFGISYGF